MKKRLALAALLAAAPFAVSAQALSYTYVEGGYDQTTIDEEQYISQTKRKSTARMCAARSKSATASTSSAAMRS